MVTQGRFDYAIVGGGTAGCVLASRLSEDPRVRVVLLEAGSSTGPEIMASPNNLDALALWDTPVNWGFDTTPQAGLNNASRLWPRGKVLGGSSAINGMMHTRGHRSSYDAWAKSGATEWNYASMLPYLKRSEHTEGKDPNFRGTAGPMRIEEPPSPSPLMQALFQAAVDTGLPATDDGNGCGDEGVFWHESNVVAGRRQSAADAYLRPALSRPNLTVVTDALVLRLVMDGSHCRGVEYAANGRTATITVERDVVLCAGVIGSPQILMLSGMGPAEHLHEHDVAVRMNLPGVGANLHDHPLNWISFDAKDVQDSPAPSAGGAALIRTSSDVDPDLWLAFVPAEVKPLWRGGGPGLSILFSLVNPASRGTVRLRSANPDDQPLIDPAYLTEEADVARMLVGLKLARAIARSEALAQWRDQELLPGEHVVTEDALRAYLRQTSGPFFHGVGTCRMGIDDLAVVDPHLRVHGVDGLRVADASVMPTVISAPTNAAVLGIAERAADMIASIAHP